MIFSGSAAPQCGNNSPIETANYTGKKNLLDAPKRQEDSLLWYTRGYLPHLDSLLVIQHISFHLADSLPHEVIKEIHTKEVIYGLKKLRLKTQWNCRAEMVLDQGYGSCVLQVPEVANCMIDTLFHFDAIRYQLLEWVVMPNHCHVLIQPLDLVPLFKIVLSWKNYTARFIRQYLRCRMTEAEQERSAIWQREYWDRYIRNQEHLMVVKEYIRRNPVRAGLVEHPEDWPWSSAHPKYAK